VSLEHAVSLRFVSSYFEHFGQTFQVKNSKRSAPANTALTQVLYNTQTGNRHLCGSEERNGTQKITKVSFGRTMMPVFEILQLAKRMKQH